ncbi:MAG: 3-hydroxyacyl-CoA dehydrogenase NAD-binding domain-containing protein [bacterium]
MSYARIEKDNDVAVIWLDQPESSVNTLSLTMLDEFSEIIDQVEQDEALIGAVLISAKKDTFIAGADIEQFTQISGQEASELSRNGNRILNKLADSSKTFVAAIHGAALGGGLEVAMACHYRILSKHKKTVLGVPEVKLGLLPGGGGTQRLPRLIGARKSLDLLLTGRNVYPVPAKRMGLVDELIHPQGLLQAAVSSVREGRKSRVRKLSVVDKILEQTSFGRDFLFDKALQGVNKKTMGLYPAPGAILQCVQAGLEGGLAKGQEKEAELFGFLQQTSESKALVKLFLAMQKQKHLDVGGKALDYHKIGILGAGFMGAGVAEVSIRKKVPVVLRDLNNAALGKGLSVIQKNLQRNVKKKAMSSFERDALLAQLELSTEISELNDCPLIIEAVFEDLALKKKILAEVEALPLTPIFASNTSSLPLSSIIKESNHPERVVGMHYFSPVPKMPLLEVIYTEKTDKDVLQTVVDLGKRQGKTVVVVKDGPGFYTTRILSAYMHEAMELLLEGGSISAIDKAMKKFGFPVGPFALMDEVGLDVGAHISRGALTEMFSARGIENNGVILKLAEQGLKGRKTGSGFYQYGRKKEVNSLVHKVLNIQKHKNFSEHEIQKRLNHIFVNEALHCLNDGIISSKEDGDLAAILGLGYPPFRGGPFSWLQTYGEETFKQNMQELEAKYGARFC